MTLADLGEIFFLLVAVLVFTTTVNFFHRRAEFRAFPSLSEASLSGRVRTHLLVGTDDDLKIELGYLLYTVFLILVTHAGTPRVPAYLQSVPAVVLAGLAGFHFRQWLSKWRL